MRGKWCRRWGRIRGFGVTDEGGLVSQMRGLPSCLTKCKLTAPKRRSSAGLSQFLRLTASKTKQFCETSFKHKKLSAELTGSYQYVFAVFPVHLSKLLRLPRKSEARSYEVLHLSRWIIWANLKIWCSKCIPSHEISALTLTSLMKMSLVLRLPREMHCRRSSAHAQCVPSFLKVPRDAHVWLTFVKVQNPLGLPRKTASALGKSTESVSFFTLLTSKCASRHNGVHFFPDILNSKSGPRSSFFNTFDFEMCFLPQRRALFEHLNISSSKSGPRWSETVSF